MTEIDKLIEEYTIDDFERMAMETDYAIEANEDTCKVNEADAGAFYKEGLVAGINFILHQNRWRKVEEELPEYRDDDYQVLGLLKNGEYKTIWVIKDSIPQIEVFAYHGVTEWKPIE